MIDLDTVVSADSWEAALHGAGGAVSAAERLLAGSDTVAFCGTAPARATTPRRDRAMGFCLFNNVAVAAAHALAACGAERVLVLDWDVHHGNGTEAIFADSAAVLYASIHQSPLYPGTGSADYDGVGRGRGLHRSTCPVAPGRGARSSSPSSSTWSRRWRARFDPDLLVISAGYDAHRDDPLASCRSTTRTSPR